MTKLRKVAAAAGLMVIGAGILLYLQLWNHPSSEEVQQARAAATPHRARDLLQSNRPFDAARWKELLGNTDESLDLNGAQMEWSSASYNAGYLYFHQPGYLPRRMVWEFAPCARTNLSEIVMTDVPERFHRFDSAEGPHAFGSAWKQESLYVMPGDVVFARLIDQPGTVYAVQVLEQSGSLGEQVRVGFRVFSSLGYVISGLQP